MSEDSYPGLLSEEDLASLIRSVQRYGSVARDLRRDGEYNEAATYYVAKAHGELMRFRRIPEEYSEQAVQLSSPFTSRFGHAMQDLVLGVLCFRIGASVQRCQNHAMQGCLVVDDILEEDVYTASAQIGLCHEIKGDLQLLARNQDFDESYRHAENYYRDVDSPLGWQMEDEFDEFSLLLVELGKSADFEFEPGTVEKIRRLSLRDRIEFRRNHFPIIIEEIVEAGHWDSDIL